MLRRLPAAITDVDEIWFYIAQDNLAAASRMVERITDATARLEAFPASGTPRPDIHPAARSIAVAPYIIYYRDRKSTRLELQSLMRISYAVFCLKKTKQTQQSTYLYTT